MPLKHKLIFLLAGLWLFGVGLRMVTQWIHDPNSYFIAPNPSVFDYWFDWSPMPILGGLLIFIVLREFWKDAKHTSESGN